MSATTDVLYEKRGSAAWLTLNRPEQLNSLGKQLLEELDEALTRATNDAEVRSIVFTGNGRAFCAGADLKFIDALPADERQPAMVRFLLQATTMMNRVAATPKPTIAAVNGIVLAGGMELVLACDLVIAAKDAKMGDGHATYGLIPGAGASARLPRKIGMTRAKWLFYTADLVSADEMLAAGLVNRVVPTAADLAAEVDALTAKLATRSPLMLRQMKQLADDSVDVPLEHAIRNEHAVASVHATSFDYAEGIRAFNDKRKPSFQGR
jgi:enoyl-CoA hydratase